MLIVEDDSVTQQVLSQFLRSESCDVRSAFDLKQAHQELSLHTFDLVFLDLHLGGESGFSLLPTLSLDYPQTKAVVCTAHGSIELAVKAVQAGATGFITKPFSREKIREAIQPVIKEKLREQNLSDGPWTEVGMIGMSPAMRVVQSNIMRMKDVDSTVLISGESGTGKELVARSLHRFSSRAHERFEAINCGAIPENLIESELFGHRRGSFTDAKQDRKGLFEICKSGVVFLDEVGELPLLMQVKLLRVLQEREFTPIGSNTPIKVDTRVIAATNRDLAHEVRSGRFREDLYFRLAVLCINVPSLSERSADIPLLVKHFLKVFNARFRKEVQAPTPDLITKLCSHHWQGNIRELQNAVERGVVLSQDGHLRFEDMLLNPASPSATFSAEANLQAPGFDPSSLAQHVQLGSLSKAKEEFESAYLKRLLQFTVGNVSEASRVSGRYRADLYRLFAKYDINPSEFKS